MRRRGMVRDRFTIRFMRIISPSLVNGPSVFVRPDGLRRASKIFLRCACGPTRGGKPWPQKQVIRNVMEPSGCSFLEVDLGQA